MKKNMLGRTGIEVTQLCFGSLTMGEMQRGYSIEKATDITCHALQAGINFIDTAQMYGSYAQVASTLRQWKGTRPYISSKSTAKSRKDMEEAIEECLREIGVEHIDIFLLHALRDEEDYNSRSEALKYLKEAKANGKIKAIGASSHSAKTIKFLSEQDDIEVLHPMLNKDGIGILDASLEDMIAILKQARKNGKGIYAMKPLGGGHLTENADEALRWVFASGLVDAAAVGMSSKDEIDMNVAIAKGESVDKDFAKSIAGLPRKLFINTGICINCGACIKTCQQSALVAGEKHPTIIHEKCVLCGYCSPGCPKFALRII